MEDDRNPAPQSPDLISSLGVDNTDVLPLDLDKIRHLTEISRNSIDNTEQ